MVRVISAMFMMGSLACSGALTSPDGGTTTAPSCDAGTISITSNIPSCMWAPNHKMVLFNINDLNVTATGGCSVPKLSIVGVTSNQPDTGCGSGNTTPDYTWSSTGVCLRSESCGTMSTDRVYTITVEATDGTTTLYDNVTVTVPHDESGAAACPVMDQSRFVADNDPACN